MAVLVNSDMMFESVTIQGINKIKISGIPLLHTERGFETSMRVLIGILLWNRPFTIVTWTNHRPSKTVYGQTRKQTETNPYYTLNWANVHRPNCLIVRPSWISQYKQLGCVNLVYNPNAMHAITCHNDQDSCHTMKYTICMTMYAQTDKLLQQTSALSVWCTYWIVCSGS